MGQELSYNISKAHLELPPSLRAVQPFMYEAQRGLVHLQTPQETAIMAKRKRFVVACINRAFNLLNIFNLELDDPARQCISYYTAIRDSLVNDIVAMQPGLDATHFRIFVNNHNAFAQGARPHELIIAEANETLALAEEQFREGFSVNACLNFHCAAVYYRVMEAMLPGAYDIVHNQLKFSVARLRRTSSMSNNFIREHFTDGASCAELYDVHGSSRLGKGSYGSVYLATHRVTGDDRAVKVMNVERVTSYYLRKLHTEIEVLKDLDHPNIIKIQDVFFGKRSVYVVTDLCRGGELFELLNAGNNQGFSFREDRAAALMRDMVSAVHYLHTKCIMHRDLKLENFLFATKSATSPLILIDFGLSKRFEPGEVLNQRVGSCYYTAPEVLLSAYDYRCDVWSLGVLCYMLLSGTPPFHGNTADDVYEGILNQDVVFPEKKFRHLSAICMDFLRRLLIKDPNLRMSTAVALAHPYISGTLSSHADAMYSCAQQGSTQAIGNASDGATSASISSGVSPDGAPSSVFSFTPRSMLVHQQQRQHHDFLLNGQNLTYTPGSLAAKAAAQVASAQGGACVGRFNPMEADLIVTSISNFVLADPLIKLTALMIAHSLPPEDILFLRTEFLRIDADHNGTVSLQEFSAALSLSTLIMTKQVDVTVSYLAMCIERSHGHSSELTYHEYIAAAMCGRIEIDSTRVHLAFDSLDSEEAGIISVDSLRNTLGADIPQHILVAMIRPLELKAGSDGITIDHFMDHWINETRGWYENATTVILSGRKTQATAAVSDASADHDSSEWDGRAKMVKFAPASANVTTCYSADGSDKGKSGSAEEAANSMNVEG